MTGLLRGGDTSELTFGLVPTVADTLQDPQQNPELHTGSTILDPVRPTGNAIATFNFTDSCGNAQPSVDTPNLSLNPRTPDVDITLLITSRLVTADEQVTLSFLVVNNGENNSLGRKRSSKMDHRWYWLGQH